MHIAGRQLARFDHLPDNKTSLAHINTPTAIPPTRSPNTPAFVSVFSAPLVGEAVDAELVVVADDESLWFAFLLLPWYAVAVTPVPLVQGPGFAEVEKVISAH